MHLGTILHFNLFYKESARFTTWTSGVGTSTLPQVPCRPIPQAPACDRQYSEMKVTDSTLR